MPLQQKLWDWKSFLYFRMVLGKQNCNSLAEQPNGIDAFRELITARRRCVGIQLWTHHILASLHWRNGQLEWISMAVNRVLPFKSDWGLQTMMVAFRGRLLAYYAPPLKVHRLTQADITIHLMIHWSQSKGGNIKFKGPNSLCLRVWCSSTSQNSV